MTPAVPRYLSAASSDPGSVRDNNEDRVYADDARGFFVVIDGMGGHQAGEQAADIALERIRSRLERQTDSAEQRLREAITLANNAIFEAAHAREEWHGMACVLTAAVVENGHVAIGHVGDSRLYKIRRGKIEKITHDHSPVGEREDRGEISEAEAMRHPRRNEVYRDVGSMEHAPDDEDFIETARAPFEADSALLLCSDGLSDVLASAEILRIVEENAGDRWAAVRSLIAAANEDGKDNISAILVEGAEYAAQQPMRQDIEDTGRMIPVSRDTWYRRIGYFAGGLILGGLLVFAVQSMYPPPPLPHMPQSFVVAEDGTIAAALIKAQAGDTVFLPPGTFRELVELKTGVDLIAQKPQETILEGSLVANSVDHIRLEGLRIRAGTLGIDVRNSNVQISRCEISGAHTAGVRFSGNSSGSLIASEIRNNPGAGIAIEDAATPAIEHNTVTANGAEPGAPHPGLIIHTTGHPAVRGNYFSGNGAEAIWLASVDETIVQGNYFTPASKADRRKPFRILPAEVAPMNPGDRYGGYQIIRRIGRGAMGEVFLATTEDSDQQVALKLVYKGPDPEDQEILNAERLGAELQKRVAEIDSRVCAVKRYGEINGDLFIEMEHVDGEDLSTILSRNALAPAHAAHIAMELCEMLQHLQAFTTTIDDKQFEGVIHGDLKPRNIRLNALGQVKVLDFGIAKALSHTRKYTMNVFASTAYCSPERLETQSMDSRSDLWAVGVLLYQMVAGRLPFDAPSKEALERRIRSTSPPDVLPPGCPANLQRIIFKMLARDATRRYQSAAELKEDLEHFEKGEPVNAEAFDTDTTTRTTAGATPAADDRTIRTTRPIIEPPRVKWSRKQIAIGCLGAMGVAGLLTLGFGVYQLSVWNRAGKLRTDLETERVTNLDDAWVRYQQLAGSSHLPTLLWGAQSALKKKLVAAADETIHEYRDNDAPMVFEPQWTQARNLLARALEVDSGDNSIKGRLRLCEAHIDRIEAGTLKGFSRQKKLNSALAKFQESAELLRRWPDPYLGLARLYVYDLNDVEKAEEALNKAADYGHPAGKRERAQLGDGYRRRADRIWRDSRALREMPNQERDYLDHARQDYERAESLYQKAGLFGDSARNEIQAMQGQQRVEQRLSELQRGWLRQ